MGILKTVSSMSIIGSILFLIFQIIKPLTKKNFNASWHYRVSIIILIFFILPIGSFISFPRISNDFVTKVSQIDIGKIGDSEIATKVEDMDHIPDTRDTDENFVQEDYKYKMQSEKSPIVETKENNHIKKYFDNYSYEDIILYIWLIGMIVLFLSKSIPYIKFKSTVLKNSIKVEDIEILELFNQCKNELNINSNIKLKHCQYIGSPMLIGILNPMILIPNTNEDKNTLKMIFLHELNHYKRKDIIIKAFGFFVNIIHWFNPIVYLLLRDMDNYCECSIDEKVVKEMKIEDRKYYGETILKLIDNSRDRRYNLTTAMSSSGEELKSRLENMLFFKKSSKKRIIISLFVTILIISFGFTIACNIMPAKAVDENNSFVVYIKEDGLYYSYLDNGEEFRVHEGKEFSYPIISKTGMYIAYTHGTDLYVYDFENGNSDKLAKEIVSYDWIDEDTIIYSTEKAGFTIHDMKPKKGIQSSKDYIDEYYYENFKVSKDGSIYGNRISKWTVDNDKYAYNTGIVEIILEKNGQFKINTIVEGRKFTDDKLGYSPIISKITEDGRYIFIMEKFASGSLSADGIGIGLYDTKEKIHIDFTDIYGSEGMTYGEGDEDLVVLPFANNVAINPKDSNLIAIIKGGFRERFMNKEVVLFNINKDKSYEIINIMEKDLVAMTPSFTLDGDKLLYSATKAIDPHSITDFNQAYKDWENQPHNIYEYDLKNSQVRKLTKGNEFDFMPINISKDEILICRLKDNGYSSLIKIIGEKEEIFADDVMIDYITEENIDIFLGKNNKKNKYNIKENNKNTSIADKLYELRGGKIGDNSRVGNIINLLNFPKDLESNGIELFTKEEPYGLQINFSADTDTKMKYTSMSSDDVWRSQSLILFSLIDNLDYIKYAIDDGKGNIIVSSINREQADSITVSVMGHKTSHIAKNKKRFKEFYNVFVQEDNLESQNTNNIKNIEIIFNEDNNYFDNKGPISITDKKMINDIVGMLDESQPIQDDEKMNNIRDMAYKDNKLILTDIDNEKSEIKFTFDTLYEIGFIEMDREKLEPKYDFFRYILDLIEYGKYETNIDSEVVELFKKYNWTIDYRVNTIKEKLPSDLKHEAGEHPIKIYWAYNNELSKSIGFDFSKYLGDTVVAEIYTLREPLPEYMKPMLNARGIVLKKDGKIIGAYIDAGRHESFACSLNRKSLEDIVNEDWDEWIKDYIDYDNKLEKEIAQLSPEGVIKTYFEALNSHNVKRAKACLARTKSNINLDLSANMSNIELYNKKAEDYYNNIKSVNLLEIKKLDKENEDSNTLSYRATADYKYKKMIVHEDGVLPYTVLLKKETKNGGWKIQDIGF